MADKRKPTSSSKNISIGGNVKDTAVFIGDNNTVNQTIIQKIINYIFPSEKETLEQRNRRILLGHVENAWIKGVLDASLHGAALLDLGIKQDPEAVTKYPWAIKKESTDETLPAGTSMLEVFDSIGMGRSLLILGAPGSGKTTMLLELARQLVARAREDVTQPIPMVFNLASWTEKLTLADWLAQELNNLYSVPRKTAPDWVKGNKLLLLLDGLDEVRQENRAKCVEAINAFRKEYGLTSLAVCSRSQDYADLNTKLSFEGAIEVQPLTQKQITEFFNRFGKEMAGIKQVLKRDSALREMAETPLFLSIMIMAYRDKQEVDIWVFKDENAQRKHLFDTYIGRMFERPRSMTISLQKQNLLHWLSWLASKMTEHSLVAYLFEDMQPEWLDKTKQTQQYKLIRKLNIGLIFGLSIGLVVGLIFRLSNGLIFGLMFGLMFGLLSGRQRISTVDSLSWNWNNARKDLLLGLKKGLFVWLISGLLVVLISGVSFGLMFEGGGLLDRLILGQMFNLEVENGLYEGLIGGLIFWLIFELSIGLRGGLSIQQVNQTIYLGQRLIFTAKSALFAFLLFGLLGGLIIVFLGSLTWVYSDLIVRLIFGLIGGLLFGLWGGLIYGGHTIIQHYTLRFILARNNLLPWRLVPFLDHCVDLIFLRRVGGGYIFIHRLLMEHFAEMYVEDNA